MLTKKQWCFLVFYLAIWGSFCGLEIDTHVEDLPFFQITTLLMFINVLFVLLLPPLSYAFFASRPSLWSKRWLRTILLLFNSIYLHLAILLLLYKAARNMDFDFYFFWYNLSVALSVLWRLFAPWLVVIALSLAAFVYLQKLFFSPIATLLKQSPRKVGLILAVITISSMLCQIITLKTVRGSLAGFLYASFFSDRQLRTDYHTLYENHLKALQTNSIIPGVQVDPSVLGDMVIFVQQESLNSHMVGPKITPQLLRASRNGILFNTMYGNSIQSERGYECILCGVPPSIAGDLVEDYPEDAKKLHCLPKIFKSLGYRPIVFYSGNPNPRVTRLFEFIGFEKILSDEIMKPGDVMYDWGYREDIFFTRVDEYLQKHYINEKLFIFITASASNHTPFKVLDKRLADKVPFPEPKKFEERLSNTTFVQDTYFGHLYDIFTKHYAHRGSLIAVSDHAWPVPIHKHNIYNERGAFEENFKIALLFIPPSSRRPEYAIGSTVTQRFSQMDIVPTLLDLIGMEQTHWLGESFAPWLLATPDRARLEPQKIKISLQPYGGGFISAVQYPNKYLFDVLGENVKAFDLQKDPSERSPEIRDVEKNMYLIKNFFLNKNSY
jgi:hypothetical protein